MLEFSPFYVFAALEHQVFEKMGKARSIRLFVLGSHVVSDVYGHDRGTVIAVKDDMKSVFQVEFLKIDFIQLSGCGEWKCAEQDGQKTSYFK